MTRSDTPTLPSEDVCQRALAERDPQWDGVFLAGTATTRIYCRPSCPAPPARAENLRFFKTPDAARAAGYRACLRCAPDATFRAPQGG